MPQMKLQNAFLDERMTAALYGCDAHLQTAVTGKCTCQSVSIRVMLGRWEMKSHPLKAFVTSRVSMSLHGFCGPSVSMGMSGTSL